MVSQALLAGNVDAAYLSYTYVKIVQNKGFRVLADSKSCQSLSRDRDHHPTKHHRLVGWDGGN